MYHAPVETVTDKVNRLEELDLAMSGTQTSSISCDTIPVAHAACKHGSFDRSASVSSTAGTLTRSLAHAQAALHGASQTTMRASSQGSKVCLQWPYPVQLCPLAVCVLTEGVRLVLAKLQRSFDINIDEEDTPTKRAKVRRDKLVMQ